MRWTYRLLGVVLVSRIVQLLLYETSDISDWCWYLFTSGWFVLLFFALWDLIQFRWRQFLIASLVLVATALPAVNIGMKYIQPIQDSAFRLHALHLIRSEPVESFCQNASSSTMSMMEASDNGSGSAIRAFVQRPGFSLSWFMILPLNLRCLVIAGPSHGGWRFRGGPDRARVSQRDWISDRNLRRATQDDISLGASTTSRSILRI